MPVCSDTEQNRMKDDVGNIQSLPQLPPVPNKASICPQKENTNSEKTGCNPTLWSNIKHNILSILRMVWDFLCSVQWKWVNDGKWNLLDFLSSAAITYMPLVMYSIIKVCGFLPVRQVDSSQGFAQLPSNFLSTIWNMVIYSADSFLVLFSIGIIVIVQGVIHGYYHNNFPGTFLAILNLLVSIVNIVLYFFAKDGNRSLLILAPYCFFIIGFISTFDVLLTRVVQFYRASPAQ